MSSGATTPPQPAGDPVPQTGIVDIDEATAAVADLHDAPLSEHHDRLAEAHSVLEAALHSDDSTAPGREADRGRDRAARP